MLSRFALLILLLLAPGLLSCHRLSNLPTQPSPSKSVPQKVTFDLTPISAAGLIGSNDSLRSVSYEFCIPATEMHLMEVRTIDSTVQFSRSPGRIRCTSSQYLGIGTTYQPNWRSVLTKLAELDYIQRIDQFGGE